MYMAFIAIASALLVHIGVSLYAGAVVFKYFFGIPVILSITIIAIVTAIYTVLGGLTAVLWTDMVQFIILVGGAVWLVFATSAGKKLREALGFERKMTDQIIVGVERIKATVINGEKADVKAALQGAQDRDVQQEVIRRKAELTT